MQSKLKKVLIGQVVLAIILFVIGYGLYTTSYKEYYLPVMPFMLLFFLFVNGLVMYFKHKAFHERPESFPRKLMAINGARIFSYLIFIVIYFVTDKEHAVYFLVAFALCYMFFLVYDLIASKKLA